MLQADPKDPFVIRRFLIVMFTMLVWSVQTVDAAVCSTENCAQSAVAGDAQLVADDGGVAGHVDAGLGCGANCICHALHHGFINDTAPAPAHLAVARSVFALFDCAVALFGSAPPVRPPLA